MLVQLRGRRVGLSHGNGVESTFGYDDRIRLVRLEHATGGDVFESCGYVNDSPDVIASGRRAASLAAATRVGRSIIGRSSRADGQFVAWRQCLRLDDRRQGGVPSDALMR